MTKTPDGAQWIEQLARQMGALSDWRQRAVLFGKRVSKTEPALAVRLFERVLALGFGRRDHSSKRMVEAAMLALAHDLWPAEHRARTFEAASEETQRLTRIYLRDQETPEPEAEAPSFKVPDYGLSRPLTLGERRSIASRPDRRLLEYALLDPHPMVRAKLLDNPKITENDIVRMASRRPAPPEGLVEIGRHPRWRSRHRIASALVRNPYMEVAVGLTLLPTLRATDATEIARDSRLHPLIREACAGLLSHRQNLGLTDFCE